MHDRAQDLAALMCSKLCHDLVSPIGALGNGLEVLEDETDTGMRATALELIADSARSAAAKLLFARLAYGSAGGMGGSLDMGEAIRAAEEYFATTKAKLIFSAPAAELPKNLVRLCLNMLIVALDCIPRGGTLSAKLEAEPGAHFTLRISAAGQNARWPEAVASALEGEVPEQGLDARLVQPFLTGELLRTMGARIAAQPSEAEIALSVEGPC